MKKSKIQGWAIKISGYDAPILYHPGKHNISADMLSRIAVTSSVGQCALVSHDSPSICLMMTWKLITFMHSNMSSLLTNSLKHHSIMSNPHLLSKMICFISLLNHSFVLVITCVWYCPNRHTRRPLTIAMMKRAKMLLRKLCCESRRPMCGMECRKPCGRMLPLIN